MTGQNQQHTVIFSGGGTSGHIHPAIAIAQHLQALEPSARILFCGTPQGLEHEIVPRAGFEFVPIRASGFPRRLNRALVRAVQDYGAGRRRAMELIREYRPDAVVGTGGYVCSPLLSAAAKLGVPRLIHEQNAFPGRSNRLLSHGAAVVCISYEGTRPYFGGADKVVLTGNPVRSVFSELGRAAARAKLGLDPGRKLILATGGSLGARRINEAVVGVARANPNLDAQIILACGQRLAVETAAAAEGIPAGRLRVEPYLYDMPIYMAAADLLISRAGAIACAEIAALGRCSILVPYPYAAADHQTWNARAFSDQGAACLCPDSELTPAWLGREISRLLGDSAAMAEMAERVHALARPNAVDDITAELRALF